MLPKDLFQKIRRIEITTNRLVTDVFAGQYGSVFSGRGMEFDEVREYQPGDDIRTIDWNVTARTGKPHIKKYVEERELTVMLLVDGSLSCHFASSGELKSKLAAQIAAVLAFAAIRNNDKVGLIFFTDKIEKFIPPRKGRINVLRLVREILYFTPQNTKTDLGLALDFLSRVTARRSVAFLLSDFLEGDWPSGRKLDATAPFKKNLSIANKRHDMIAVTLNDRREHELPNCGLLYLEDAENGRTRLIDSASDAVRQSFSRQAAARMTARNRLLDSLGIDHIDLWTDKDFSRELVRFFLQRRRRKANA